ncbi:cob(I)yrinic acid a,c-diamide adenosyltransferase [Lentilactobacillus sp. Marseille-Q4993]|uniref:cob(I)yrinic acid a,c-diamide adenosyltransferase n=1 Tax=Lentilactobacillus sp. Marseille-Q4993 TaxID=3039492 RepID=UPI0024BD4156|nr:cob(I)yrinic acid a,c-diamide adenosyltransferase [Lentilactobacillus sp. Marseille-Q4993]
MKIYTRAGDKGRTQLIGHKIVGKDDLRVDAYGTVDELNSWVGYTDSILSSDTKELHEELQEIQQLLFDVGRDLATPIDDKKHDFIFTDEIATKATKWLEEKIDKYTAAAPKIDRFILPGGSPEASAFHVARTTTRRAERKMIALQHAEEINPQTEIFINRLSDYFFAVARYANVLKKTDDVLYRNGNPVFR